MIYLYELGFATNLAIKEIDSFFGAHKVKYSKEKLSNRTLLIKHKSDLNPTEILSKLGGTIRIAEQVGRFSFETKKSEISLKIANLLSDGDGKVTFSITSLHTHLSTQAIMAQVKEDLQSKNVSSRYLQVAKGLTPPIQLKDGAREFIITSNSSKEVLIFDTVAVTDVLAWQKRDRGRPFVDAESGVLPPKVARIMINIATRSNDSNQTLLDPFCGSGTVLMEAQMVGFNVIGLDNSSKAVSDSKQNLEWLSSFEKHTTTTAVYEADSSSAKPEDFQLNKVDMIVGEGYLGPSRFNKEDLPEIIEELRLLYSKALPNLGHWLRKNGSLVIALPKFNHPESQKMHAFLIDTCRESGYTFTTKPLEYSQLNARVKRLIYILEKK